MSEAPQIDRQIAERIVLAKKKRLPEIATEAFFWNVDCWPAWLTDPSNCSAVPSDVESATESEVQIGELQRRNEVTIQIRGRQLTFIHTDPKHDDVEALCVSELQIFSSGIEVFSVDANLEDHGEYSENVPGQINAYIPGDWEGVLDEIVQAVQRHKVGTSQEQKDGSSSLDSIVTSTEPQDEASNLDCGNE